MVSARLIIAYLCVTATVSSAEEALCFSPENNLLFQSSNFLQKWVDNTTGQKVLQIEQHFINFQKSLEANKKETDAQLKTLMNANNQLKADLNAYNQENIQLKAVINASNQETAQLKTALNANNQQTAELKASLNANNQQTAELKASLNANNQENVQLKAVINASNQETAQLKTALNAYKQETAELKAAFNANNQQTAELKASLNANNQENVKLRETIKSITDQLNIFEEKIQQNGNSNIDDIRNSISDLRGQLSEYELVEKNGNEFKLQISKTLQQRMEIINQHSAAIQNINNVIPRCVTDIRVSRYEEARLHNGLGYNDEGNRGYFITSVSNFNRDAWPDNVGRRAISFQRNNVWTPLHE